MYFPETELPKYPPNELRILEENINKLFKIYTRFYYGQNAVSSVFVWEQGDTIQKGFSAVLLIKNEIINDKKLLSGDWNSKNVISVNFYIEKDKNLERIKATYKINTNVIFRMKFSNGQFSGDVSKQAEESYYIREYLDYETHIEKMGKMVENIENQIRLQIEEIYFKKTNEVRWYCLY